MRIFNGRIFYGLFRFFHGMEGWSRRRLTSAGRMIVGAIVAAAVVGVDTNRTLGYQAFCFFSALMAVAVAWTPFFRARLTARRLLPRYGTAGSPVAYRVVIENRGRRVQRGLFLMEEVADGVPDYQTFVSTPEPGERRRNFFDRFVRFYRFQWLVETARPRLPGPRPMPDIPAGGTAAVVMEVTPARRGALRFTGVTIARPDPLGLVHSLLGVKAPQQMMVLPRRYPLPPATLPEGRRYQSGGVALTTSVGDSEEFVSLRDYRPGDSLRRIHWRSWARTGKPVVKEYQDEFFVRHALVLDTFTRRRRSLVFEEAVSVAASFAVTVLTNDSLLDLVFVGPRMIRVTSGRGLSDTNALLEALAAVSPCADQPFDVLPPMVLSDAGALSGCVCVLIDWDAPRRDFIARLRSANVPVRVLLITKDGAPPPEPGPMADAPDRFMQVRAGRAAADLARMAT